MKTQRQNLLAVTASDTSSTSLINGAEDEKAEFSTQLFTHHCTSEWSSTVSSGISETISPLNEETETVADVEGHEETSTEHHQREEPAETRF